MIRFACPGCSTTYTVADEKAGKSGKCPKCQSQFVIPAAPTHTNPPVPSAQEQVPWTPGVLPPERPSQHPTPPAPSPNPTVEIRPCPQCGARLSVVTSEIGLEIECPTCRTVFQAVRADAQPPPDSGRPTASTGTLVRLGSGSKRDDNRDDDERDSRRGRSSRRRDDDEDDDRPSRRRRSRYDDDDDDDDRPSRRRSSRYDDDDDDDNDYDDRPSRRRSSRRSRYDDDDDRRASKPSQIQTCGVLLLIGGIFGCLNGLAFIAAAFGVCVTFPGGVFELVYGIMALIRGSQMMGTGRDRQPPTGLCVMAIITIVNLDVLNLVFGIIGLCMLNSPEAQRYYRRS